MARHVRLSLSLALASVCGARREWPEIRKTERESVDTMKLDTEMIRCLGRAVRERSSVAFPQVLRGRVGGATANFVCWQGFDVVRLIAITGFVSVALWAWPAQATVHHVAQGSGADGNDGTEAHPWATISACAKVAQAGDVCRVHVGTYRETVSPTNAGQAGHPIRFEVADGECATVSGTQTLTASFTQDQGNVWVAAVPDSVEQLFSNGVMVWEGQWPNRTPGVLFDNPKGIAGQGTGVQTVSGASVTYLVDPNIPAGDWTGALVYIIPGERWQSDSRPIKTYDAATHTITLDTTTPWAEKKTQPVMSNQYFLYGSKLTLDVQDEWVWLNGSLYYYSADNPGSRGLEYKKRYYAFDVKQPYIEIVGFHVFGSAVRPRPTGNIIVLPLRHFISRVGPRRRLSI